MANSRLAPAPDFRNDGRRTRPLKSSVVTLSISLTIILIAPLWLQVEAAPDDSLITLASKSPRITQLAPTTYNPNPDPIPDEVLVRFEPYMAEALLQELAEATRPFAQPVLPEALLIGARLPGDRANQATPELNAFTSQFGMWAADAIDPLAGMWRLKLGRGTDPYAAVAALNETEGVEYAEPNFPIYGFTREPNDPFYTSNNQWALRKIGAPDAWDITTGSSDVTIAVLDTGLAYGHSELRNKIITQTARNFVAEPANEFAWDDNGHGTYVAGLAAAETNNGSGMAGVAWNAKLLPIKVLDYGYQGSIATLSMGLAYVATQPVQVVNMSTGGPVRSRILEETAQKAYDQGIVLVAAAGNGGKEEFNYPAAFDTVIAVGASDEQDRPASFSSYGPYLSLVAPGTDILSLNWASDKDYARNYGTSPSCPLVAGTVALMMSVNPNLTPRQVRSILEGTADNSSSLPPLSVTPGANVTPTSGPGVSPTPPSTPIPVSLTPPAVAQTNSTGAIRAATLPSVYTNQFGWGRLNAYRAVLAVRNGESFPSRHATLSGTVAGFPDPLDVMITLNPGDTRYPDQNDHYQFDHLPPGTYQLVIESTKYNLRSSSEFTIQGTDGETVRRDFDFANQVTQALNGQSPVGPFRPLKNVTGDSQLRYFPESGHTLAGRFKDFWESRGGLPIFGYPISEEFEEGGKTVQYFERVVLEYNPEYANTRAEVQPRLLGELAAQIRGEAAFKRLAPAGTVYPVAATTRYFDETGHTLSGPYRVFWEANGGLALFGYPVSEPFNMIGSDGKLRQVQYFQRCRLEYFPESSDPAYIIQIGFLAKEAAQASGLLGKG